MVIRAIVFDIGGVLEQVESLDTWSNKWQRILGMSDDEFTSARQRADPRGQIMIGGMTDAEFQRGVASELGLTERQSTEFTRDLWDWYCGELDEELMAYARTVRSHYATALLSNSGAGAREQEEARYEFSAVFDPIVYSHEVGFLKPDRRIYALTCARLGMQPDEVVFLDDAPENVDAARDFGMNAVLHSSTATSIDHINQLLQLA